MHAPVIEAVRVPPSACKTSQSILIVRSPNFFRSTTARNDRPISLCISILLAALCDLVASRSILLSVERGIMPYSAVTQPCPLPFRNRGTESSTDALHKTLVSPNSIRTEPSAYLVYPLVIEISLSSPFLRPPNLIIFPASIKGFSINYIQIIL